MNIGKFLRTPFHTTSLVAASRLNTYLKLITESVDQGAKSIENFQKRHQERNRKNRKKTITVNKEMFIVHQKNTCRKA